MRHAHRPSVTGVHTVSGEKTGLSLTGCLRNVYIKHLYKVGYSGLRLIGIIQ